MKDMNSLGLKICSYQAMLFEKSIVETECSSAVFIRRFMNSELAKRIDNAGCIFDSVDITDAIDEIEQQYGENGYGSEKFSPEEMYWIGYLYRYFAYTSGMSSKQIYRVINSRELRKLYYPYHSLDPAQAIERILEAAKHSPSNDYGDIARGVQALRKVRENSRYNL